MNLEWFQKLYRHMEWADALVWREVLAHEPSTTDPYVRDALTHLHLVQHAYLTGWQGGTPARSVGEDHATLEDLQGWAREFYPAADAFLGSLTDVDLRAVPGVLWPELIERAIGRPPVPIPLADMVFQVASHSVHHRAQINRRLRELDGNPPFIDYVAWAWLGEPEADWP